VRGGITKALLTMLVNEMKKEKEVKSKNIYINKVDLKKYGKKSQVNVFAVTGKKPSRSIVSELERIIINLKYNGAKMKSQFKNFKVAISRACQDIQLGVEMAWKDLKVAYDSAKNQFEKETS
jgi:ribosomal protein S9